MADLSSFGVADPAYVPPPVGGTREAAPAPAAPFVNLHAARVLVTGGAGFVGSSLVRRLVQDFKAHVTVIDNLWRGSLDNLRGVIDLDTQFVKGDLTHRATCMRHIREADVIFHLADIVAGVDYVFGNQPFVFRNNLLINTNVLEAVIANGIKNYIYVGTACSFPQHLQMVQEGTVALHEDTTYPAEPESSYGWSKLMGEYEASLARASGAVNVGLLRLHNVYGPGSPYDAARSQALPSLIRKALSDDEPFTVWGSGEQYRDFLYIDDVMDGLIAMAERGMNQGVIQIGTGTPTTLKTAATIVGELAHAITGRSVSPTFDRSKPEGDRGRIAVLERATRILGWSAKVDIRTGLERTFRWVLEDMRAAATKPPLTPPGIPQMAPWFGQEEADAVSEYMTTGAYLTEFKQTKKFESMLADFIGVKHAIAVNNGTVSLSIALYAVGVRAGDDVLVPDWTMVATPNSVKMLGANPVFVDIEPETFCIDIAKVEAAITPRTKAVVHVSMNARTNDIAALAALCKRRGVVLIEDSAQALGSYHHGVHLGTFGAVGSLSFSAPKIISTGQGGALITNDDKLAEAIRKIKDFGRAKGGTDKHDVIGWNFKFTDMQGIVGVEQMKKLPFRVKRMRQIWEQYKMHLQDVPQVEMCKYDEVEQGWIPWFIDIFVEDKEGLQQHLKSHGIGTRFVYPAIHTQDCYPEFHGLSFPVTEHVARRGIWLPSSSKLSDAEVARVCNAVKSFYGRTASKL